MGIEAFVVPWFLAMLTIVALGAFSTGRMVFRAWRRRDRLRQQAENQSFWVWQLAKVLLVAFAFWQLSRMSWLFEHLFGVSL